MRSCPWRHRLGFAVSGAIGDDMEGLFPQLEPIRDALRQATLESGFGFWDLYEAMGGSNSMPSFVQADPPLASRDYLHFTPKGANLVAEMFYNALMLEYNHFSAQYSDN